MFGDNTSNKTLINKTRKHNKVYSAWLPNVSHDTIHGPLAATMEKFLIKQ